MNPCDANVLRGSVCALALGALASVVGCADPDGIYDDFKDRVALSQMTSSSVASSSSSTGSGGDCPPMNNENDGKYFLLLAAYIAPNKPIGITVDATSKPNADGGLDLKVTAQALSYHDRRTPVGAQVKPSSAVVDSKGAMTITFDEITIDGEANPITPGSAIVASNVMLTGGYCNKTFLCGDVTGMTSAPLTLDLATSTWTMQPIVDGTFPAVDYINCAQTVGDPPPG